MKKNVLNIVILAALASTIYNPAQAMDYKQLKRKCTIALAGTSSLLAGYGAYRFYKKAQETQKETSSTIQAPFDAKSKGLDVSFGKESRGNIINGRVFSGPVSITITQDGTYINGVRQDEGLTGSNNHSTWECEKPTTRQLTIAEQSALEVGNDLGAINVRAADQADLLLTITRCGANQDERNKINTDVSQSRKLTTIKTQRTAPISNALVNYELLIPKDRFGSLHLSNSSGTISTEKLFTNLTAHTSSGNIVSKGANQFKATSTSGDISAENVTKSAEIRTTSGSITANNINGDAFIGSTSGKVKANTISGQAEIRTTSGSISAANIKRNTQIASTSGSIKVANAQDAVTCKTTSGDISLNQQEMNGPYSFESNSGKVTVNTKALDAVITARTNSGRFKSDFDILSRINDNFDKKVIAGIIGKGKYAMNIRTTSGDINLRKS